MKKSIIYTLLFGSLLLSTSCERQLAEFDMVPECQYVTLPTDMMKLSLIEGEAVSFEVWRGNTQEAASIPLLVDCDEDIFSVPATAEFAKGESKVVVNVAYDIAKMDFGVTYSVDVAFKDAEQVSPSGLAAISLKLSRKLTLTPACTGIYYSDGYEAEWEQELCRAEEDPSFYALTDCWVSGTDFIFQMVDGQPVFPEVIETGDDWGYGPIVLLVTGATLEDGAITIDVEYYEPSDDYNYGPGVEIFTLPEGFDF